MKPAEAKYQWGTSRIGIATSKDRWHSRRYTEPVLHVTQEGMGNTNGGCQDPRITEAPGGAFVMSCTAWDRKFARLAIAGLSHS